MKPHCSNSKNKQRSLKSGKQGTLLQFQKIPCAILLLFLLFAQCTGTFALAAAPQAGKAIQAAWLPLYDKFVRDGISPADAQRLLASLPKAPTPDPMGKKALELYRKDFMPETQKRVRADTWYKGVVTEANAMKCREYIAEHKAAFESAQHKYGVPPAIAAALLFVETRLGSVLADVPENAFYVLASMAVSRTPRSLGSWLDKMPNYQQHLAWFDTTLKKRSDWAYNEALALARHIIRDRLSPDRLPSSIYGAIGLCQFMPSNISTYGADGDGDGLVDLFNPDDAIASLSNYLARHGWKPGLTTQARHKCLMAYNHSKVYANTILALANLVEGRPALQGAPKTTRHKK